MTPQGYYTSLTKALKAHANRGDLAALRAFLGGRLREEISRIDPGKVESILAAIDRAKRACEANTRLPAKPKPCTAKGAKLDWQGNVALRARLAALYAKHGPNNHTAVAAAMRISEGQARLAKRRYLDAVATQPMLRAA